MLFIFIFIFLFITIIINIIAIEGLFFLYFLQIFYIIYRISQKMGLFGTRVNYLNLTVTQNVDNLIK